MRTYLDDIKEAYMEWAKSPLFKIIMADLERVARKAGTVDGNNVNPHNAIYRVAQEDLVQYVKKMTQERK